MMGSYAAGYSRGNVVTVPDLVEFLRERLGGVLAERFTVT